MLRSMGAVLARQVRRFRAGVERLPITFRVFPSPLSIQSNDSESCVNEIAIDSYTVAIIPIRAVNRRLREKAMNYR